jgi:hypothetical protein
MDSAHAGCAFLASLMLAVPGVSVLLPTVPRRRGCCLCRMRCRAERGAGGPGGADHAWPLTLTLTLTLIGFGRSWCLPVLSLV